MYYLSRGNKYQFDIPVSEQCNFLRNHNNPKDDLWRSFYQYKAQMLFYWQYYGAYQSDINTMSTL